MLINFTASVTYTVKRRVVARNKHAILRRPQIKFNFLCAESDRRTECGHTVLGRYCIEASVCAKTGIFHNTVKGNDRCATVSIEPRSAPLFNIFVVRFQLTKMPCRLVIFILRIDLANTKAYAALHIEKHLSFWRNYHTAAAKLGGLSKRYRCADQVCICVIAKKFIDD